jgi:hypothetical protein
MRQQQQLDRLERDAVPGEGSSEPGLAALPAHAGVDQRDGIAEQKVRGDVPDRIRDVETQRDRLRGRR